RPGLAGPRARLDEERLGEALADAVAGGLVGRRSAPASARTGGRGAGAGPDRAVLGGEGGATAGMGVEAPRGGGGGSRLGDHDAATSSGSARREYATTAGSWRLRSHARRRSATPRPSGSQYGQL